MKVRIFIDDRNYTKWSFHELENNTIVSHETFPILNKIHPVENKIFNRDILSISEDAYEITYSSIKTNDKIAGVLLLENNKTYGRTTHNKRLLYKCVPDDKHLPVFLVPFDVKMGFNKFQKNKFVVFKYENWNDKHPQGTITETIGDVDSLEAFYEYQLYCKSLHISLVDFNDKTRKVLKQHTLEEYIEKILENKNFQIEDRRNEDVFTIDPPNSVDFDDGFSISPHDAETSKVTVYIANVYFWLETLGLWKSFSKRVSTIYLPDRRRPMLPTILSDNLCSLNKGVVRFAFSMEVIVDNNTGAVLGEPVYKNVVIKVKNNYCYEDYELLHNNIHYSKLLNISQKMDKSLKTSHELVSYWMVFMNKATGEYMAKQKNGIFRATTFVNNPPQPMIEHDDSALSKLDGETRRVIQSWNNNTGKYICYNEDQVSLEHYMMDKLYIHITSPIRRLVDLLNQMILCRNLKIVDMSQDADDFIENWMYQMEYINTTMRSIRKIQTDCELINRCFTDTTIINRKHLGVVFDKIVKNDGTNHYMVYLEKIKLLSRIITHLDIPAYSSCRFSVFLFEDEYKTKRKIRLQLLEDLSVELPDELPKELPKE